MDIEIVVRDATGAETDITEAVRIAYDMVHASMDWGSGFLDADEMAQIIALAEACGFEPPSAPGRRAPDLEEWTLAQDKAKTIRAMFKSIPARHH